MEAITLRVPHQNIRDSLISMITVKEILNLPLWNNNDIFLQQHHRLRPLCCCSNHGRRTATWLANGLPADDLFWGKGAREAQKLLERNAQDGNRLLGAFNRPMPHWLDFFAIPCL